MSKVIRIPNDLHKRLEQYAVGFDTPANVIERVLSQYEHVHMDEPDNDSGEPIELVSVNEVIVEEPVIEVVDEAPENEPVTLLPITLIPEDEARFKKELLKIKKAKIKIQFEDGREAFKTWNAFKFDSDSDVMTNLRSRAEFRQDAWQRDGIERVEVSIDYTL